MNVRDLHQDDIIPGTAFAFDGLDLDCDYFGSYVELAKALGITDGTYPAGLIITATDSDTEESINWTQQADGTWEADTDASPLVLEADGTFRLA